MKDKLKGRLTHLLQDAVVRPQIEGSTWRTEGMAPGERGEMTKKYSSY